LGSIALSVLAFVSMGLGVLLTPVPGWGALFAFGAPALALAGIVLGGRALSESKRRGGSEGTPLAGVVLSALCFFPALLTALTCGTCNALCASGAMQGNVQTSRDFSITLPSYLQPKTMPGPSADPGVRPAEDAGVLPPGVDPKSPGSTDAPRPSHGNQPGATPEATGRETGRKTKLPPPPLAPGPGSP
jgi:hypothetical protein